jgi:hypothetical protein
MEKAHKMVELSDEIKTTFLDNDLQLTPLQQRKLRSIRGFHLDLAGFSTITKETFPFIMSEIVISKVVDLLLM